MWRVDWRCRWFRERRWREREEGRGGFCREGEQNGKWLRDGGIWPPKVFDCAVFREREREITLEIR